MKAKPLFTRKNLIVLSLAFFYALILLYTGMCLDANHAFVNKRNLLLQISKLFGFTDIPAGTTIFLMVLLTAVYEIVFVGVFLYELRYATLNGKKKFGPQMLITYGLSFLACLVLSIGVSAFVVLITGGNVGTAFAFLGQSIVVSLFVYIILAMIIGGILMFVINLINVDKPFKFFDEEEQPIVGNIEDEIEEDKDDVTTSFDDVNVNGVNSSNVSGVSGMTAGDNNVVRQADKLDDREVVFPGLSKIDIDYEGFVNDKIETDTYSLEEICEKFRNYLAKEEKLYFDIETIRYFVSGFSASHLEILEGLSGTGKSSLPRYFTKFIGGNVLFMPVQATWRDKTNILGYFSDFSKTYTETEFLLKLYEASYNPDIVHMYVLDEMNISRVEYYFADLLSVLEYPVPDWKLKVMNFPHDFVPPVKLENGYIQIPANSYFVGTANKDDSTFTITDKVYDRAITIDFEERNIPFTVKEEVSTIKISNSHLQSLFEEAKATSDYLMNEEDYEKFHKITSFVYDEFDIAIGNRIMAQVDAIVPTYVACGGSKEEAIDFLLSRKLISKIEGRFEEYVKGALKKLLALVEKTYGAGVLKRSEKTIKSLMRRL